MVDYTQYVFKAPPEVADWIDTHIDSWTNDFVYPNIYRMQKKNYQQVLERISIRILVIFLGMILLSFSYLTIDLLNYYMIIIGGICIIFIGFLMLGLEVYNGRRFQ